MGPSQRKLFYAIQIVLAPLACVWMGAEFSPLLAQETRDLRVEGKKATEYVADHIVGKSWAVVIGINQYRDPKVRRLKYAVADAQSVGQELERRGYQVTLLLNEQATQRGINTELRTRLRSRLTKDDRVVIYYAGHGQDDRIEGTRTMGYLLPVDGELDDIPGTGVSMGMIKELADGLPAKHVLFLMDACYGGVAGQQTRSLPKMTEAYLKQITRERGRQLITAGGADQEAMEASDGGHGLFTYYLLKGLADGLADLNGDGIIPASELYAYLDSRVYTEAQMKGHTQRPEIWSLSAEKGEFVFFSDQATVGAVKPRTDTTTKETDVLAQERQALEKDLQRIELEREQVQRKQIEAERSKNQALQKQLEVKKQQLEREKQVAEEAKEKVQVETNPNSPPSNPSYKSIWGKYQHKQPQSSKPQLEGEQKLSGQANSELEARARPYTAPDPNESDRTGKDGAPMILLPAGDFMMGSFEGQGDETPLHRVSLDAFYMDKYEVTNRIFQQFVNATGYLTTAEREGGAWGMTDRGGVKKIKDANWRKPEGEATGDPPLEWDSHPVVSVSWEDAEAYCRWAEKRLPTEAEFEYAARAGTKTKYWWGEGDAGTRRVANLYDDRAPAYMGGKGHSDGYARTAPVGSFEPNPWGLHDMIGNVAEWTADWYASDYYRKSPDRNPKGPPQGSYRVIRGGSWQTRLRLFGLASRNHSGRERVGIGFRCAQSVSAIG